MDMYIPSDFTRKMHFFSNWVTVFCEYAFQCTQAHMSTYSQRS